MDKDPIKSLIVKNVSRETFLLLEKFVEMLLKWNKKINLVSRQLSAEVIWKEHIADSLFLAQHIGKINGAITDIGSGAGFPGLILAIIGYQCTLVEINTKKCAFLNFAIAELGLNANVKNIDASLVHGYKAKCITSRATASISKIIAMALKIIDRDTRFIFHVGKNDVVSENFALSGQFSFELQQHQNPYKDNCSVLLIKNLRSRDD